MIKLEKVGMDSMETLIELLTSSFVDAYQDVHSAKNIEAYCSENYNARALGKIVLDPTYDVFFANRAGNKVGVLVIHHHKCPLRPKLAASELKQLYLRSSEYGTGLAQYLMNKTLDLARDSGNEWVWLCVSDLNHRAQRFYSKMQFDKIGQGPRLDVGTDRLASSIMLRKLTLAH